MRIRGKVEQADVADVRKLILGKFYSMRLLIHPFVLGILLICWTGLTVLRWLPRSWGPIGMVPLAIVLYVVWFYGLLRSSEKALKRLNATLPEWITVLPEGIRL